MKIQTVRETIKVPYKEIQPGDFFIKNSILFKMVEVYLENRSKTITKRVSVSLNDICGGTYVLEDKELVIPISMLRITVPPTENT